MLSRTSQYALRALICLARHASDMPMTGQRIAAESTIPPKYLSKVLGTLVRVGLLESARGKHGGFRMVKSPDEISLIDVLAPFETFQRQECPFGTNWCSEGKPCKAHAQWQKIIEMETRFLRETTVQDVSTTHLPSGPERKREASHKIRAVSL